MDKIDFIQKAPIYYALAMCYVIKNSQQSVFTAGGFDDEFDQQKAFIHKSGLFEAAIEILRVRGVVEVVTDDFAPTLYVVSSSDAKNWMEGAATEIYPTFKKFNDGAGLGWLRAALVNINEQYDRLAIQRSEFKLMDQTLWEPIPLDRDDEKLAAANTALDEAIKIIDGDNGYAVHAPGEREVVLSNLKTFRQMTSENAQFT